MKQEFIADAPHFEDAAYPAAIPYRLPALAASGPQTATLLCAVIFLMQRDQFRRAERREAVSRR